MGADAAPRRTTLRLAAPESPRSGAPASAPGGPKQGARSGPAPGARRGKAQRGFDEDARASAARERELGEGVARENRAAADLSATDARWVFALRVAGKLEGGAAAILRPEARERLMIDARALGLRPFDGALVIAIVQDQARHARPSGNATQGGVARAGVPEPGVAERLRLVRDPLDDRARAAARAASVNAVIALACAAVAIAALIRWVLK